MDAGMFDGLDQMVRLLTLIFILFVPLGVWKAIEMIVWLVNNVTIGVGS